MVVAFPYMGGKRFDGKCMETFSHCTEAKKWYVRVPNKPAKSLAFPRNIASNVKLDTKNHILVKSTLKYCRYKHCGGRSIYLWQKCNVALHTDSLKDYH